MPEDQSTEPKPQAIDVVAKPAEDKSTPELATKDSSPDKKEPESKTPDQPKPKKPVFAILMALLIGGGLIAVAIVAQLQKN